MRIVFIADVRSPISRGWISYFIEQGHEVHVIATYPCLPRLLSGANVTQLPIAFSKLARTGPDGGIKSKRSGLFNLSVGSLRSRSAFGLIIGAWAWISPVEIYRHTRTLRRLLIDISPDIVHAMRIPFEGIIASIATPNGLPLVTSVWGNDLDWIARQNPLVARQTRQVMRRTDGLHCDCFRDVHLAKREWDLDEEKPTAVLPSSGGIKRSLFYPGESDSAIREQLRIPEDAFVVINPRGFRGYVHNETFFKAIPSVMRQIPNVVFLCSAMQNNSFAEKWVRKLDIAHAVRLLPTVPREQMADFFRLAHVSVSPSVYDGTPNSLIESMACGCFPVAGDIESVREWIIDEENGLLCDPRNTDSVAQAIMRALRDQGLRDSAREINTGLVDERVDYNRVMLEAEEFYHRVIRRVRSPALV
jgi:glycosyltransferase involved in cell wall biosynthesis